MANQYKVDPRQAEFLKAYLDKKSKTFSNALQSALAVGYEEEYAKVLTSKMPNWLSEKVKSESLLKKAERNIEEFLDFNNEEPHKAKIKADMTKFVAKGLDKQKWSERTEHTGADGKDLTITISNEIANKHGFTPSSSNNS